MTSAKDLVLPLDAYDLNAVERSVVQTARYHLIERCLSRYGLPFKPHDTRPVTYPKNASYLGWLGAKQVGTYGYSGPRGQLAEVAAAVDGIRGYLIPPSQDAVQTGTVKRFRGKPVPPEGCDGEAQRRLNGDAPGPDGVAPAKPHIYKQLYVYMDDAAEIAYQDERIKAANAAWSACMREAGHRYAMPAEAEADPRWASRRDTEPPTKDELSTAVADERCRLQVNYSGARLAAYADAQRAVIARHKQEVERLATLQRTRYANAQKVLDSA
ncbi:hypothetical protein ACFMQL_13070 [Nonomuraea fastidiosa]|uniref:hypothetical protein n=1 Tax=Nonomuraea TaxID=83681 RepID=UPI003444F197